MLISKKKYNKLLADYIALQAQHAQLAEQHTELCNKSQELVKRHVDLRNTIILHFGDDLFATSACVSANNVQSIMDTITKTGNIIQVNKWKKQTDKQS